MAEDIETNDTGSGYLNHDTVDTGSGYMALRIAGVTVTYPSNWQQAGASEKKLRGIDSSGVGTSEPTVDWNVSHSLDRAGVKRSFGNLIVTTDSIFYTLDSWCISLDKSDGSKKWEFDVLDLSFDVDTQVQEALYDGTRLYYTNKDDDVGKVFSLDPSDGSLNWESSHDKSEGSTALTKSKDYVICTRGDGGIMFAFDPSDGTHIWSQNDVGERPIAYDSEDDTIIAQNFEGKLRKYDQKDGSVSESSKIFSTTDMKSVLVADNDILCFNNGELVRASRSDLSIVYEKSIEMDTGQAFTISDAGPKIFIAGKTSGGEGIVVAKNANNGSTAWKNTAWNNQMSAESRDVCILAKNESVVYVGNSDGILKALDREDGTVHWSKSIANDGLKALAITDGVLYTQEDGDHRIKALS